MFDVFHKLPISHDLDDGKIRSRDVIVDTQVKFSTLLLQPQIHDGLAKCGYIYLSPIQQNALPLVLTGSSIIAHAKSGTGKTLIYVLPILNDFVQRKLSSLHCVVLAPTREIAKQIYDVFQNVACYVKGLQIEYFIGGTPLDMDVIKCMNCHIAIGAPGRIKHLIDLGFLKTANLEFLVLDEVDALFDHKEYAVEDIISTLPPPKQLIVCTATLSAKVGDLVKSVVPSVKYTSADKLEIDFNNISNMLIAVKQYVAPVKKDSSSLDAMRKREKLVEILKKFNFDQCFIFVNYMTLVRSICNHLISQNFSALWICSDQNQSSRMNTINKLKMNHCKILVTTDLAARGIDVHKVNLVINLGLPCPPEIYIHRMGRAGRYGSEGAVITILSEGEEMTTFSKMISVISTDPIDIHILPEQFDATMSNLDIIQCLPTEGSISVDEFCFKRQMKDNQEKTAVKMQNDKKTKKKKRKGANASKLALSNSITDQLSVVNKNNAEMANHKEDNVVSDKIVNECIRQFSQSLADFLVTRELIPEWNSLKCLFGLKDDDPTTTDESFTFVNNPPANLLAYALQIKQKNEFIDEQIMPCSVDEFLNLLNRSNNTFGRHSSGLCTLIKEISGKIERPAEQQLNVGRSITPSGTSSFDSEQSEISSQVSSVGVTSLSQKLLETMINEDDKTNISGKLIKETNASSWSEKFSGSFNLAEEFADVMINYGKDEYSSLSSKQSISAVTSIPLPSSDFQNTAEKVEVMSTKQFFNNCRRLNSDAENKKYSKETDSEMRPSKRVCNETERPHRSMNAAQDFVVVNICSQSTLKDYKVSPNQLSKNLNHSNEPSENEMQVHKNEHESRIRADEAECTLSFSDQFSQAFDNSTLENSPRNSSKMTCTSSIDFSTSQNHSNSIFTNNQLPNKKCETYIKAKNISRDFNLSDQFFNIVGTSLGEVDLQKPSRKSKTSPQRSSNNFYRSNQFSNGTQSRNEVDEKQVLTNYSSTNVSLCDQFSASINYSKYNRDESAFDRKRHTKFSILEDFKNSLNADDLGHNLFCKTGPSEFAEKEILAEHKRNAEDLSKPVTENRSLSNQFLDVSESKERLEITANVLDSSYQCIAALNPSSGNVIHANIPNIEEESGRSFNSVSKLKNQSNCISFSNREKTLKSTSHLTPEVKFKPDSSLKSIIVPEIESKSHISTVLERNNTRYSISAMKNFNNFSLSDNEANEESSLLVSNLKQKPDLNNEVSSNLKSNQVEFANYRSEYITEHSKNYVETPAINKSENRWAQRFASDCRVVRDETCDGNVTNTVRKSSENLWPRNDAVPILSKHVALGSKTLDPDSITHGDKTDCLNSVRGDPTAVTLPSLRSHVSNQQEQKIWLHHFAFIRRHSISRSRVMASQ